MPDRRVAVVLPLVAGSEPAKPVLERMQRERASAVIVQDGQGYRVHRVEDLRAAQHQDAQATAGQAQGGTSIERLSTRHAGELGLELTDLKPAWVEQAFRQLKHPAMIGAIARGAAGGRVATALINPRPPHDEARSLTYLGYNYICPKDHETYSSGGECPQHKGVMLEPVEIEP